MSTTELALARSGHAADLAPLAGPSPIDTFMLLDAYAGGLVTIDDARPDAIATISAGEMVTGQNGKSIPAASRDGKIHFHGDPARAPGLVKALEATKFKSLTIAFPFDDPRHFLQMRFMEYSQTRLLAYGDERSIHTITPLNADDEKSPAIHADLAAGTDEYKAVVARCKVYVSVYFALADWMGDEPIVIFPDGVGALYRLRFTSRHSLRSIHTTLKETAAWTNGRLAGVPFELRIDYSQVGDSRGIKRKIPVWHIATKPPTGQMISSRNYRSIMQAALASGAQLGLPAPRPETLEMALAEPAEPDLDELTDDQAELLQRGGKCDADYWKRRFHSLVDGTPIDSDDARARWFRGYTNGRTTSLAAFLANASDSDAAAMIERVQDDLGIPDDARESRQAPTTREQPLTRQQFLEAAYRMGHPEDRPLIAAALGYSSLGRLSVDHTWDEALEALERLSDGLPAWPESESDEAPVGALWSDERAVSEEEALPGDEDVDDGGPPDTLESLEERLSEEDAEAVEMGQSRPDDIEPAPAANPFDVLMAEAAAQKANADPLAASAQDAIRAVRKLVGELRTTNSGHPTLEHRHELRDAFVQTLMLSGPDIQPFLNALFGPNFSAIGDLTRSQIAALLAWIQRSNGRARQQASAIVQTSGTGR